MRAVSEKTAGLLDLKVGDELTVKKDDREYQVKIAVITENYAGHYVYMTPNVYKETFGEDPDYADIVFAVRDEYKDQTESIGQKIMESPAVLSISYTASTMDMVNRMLSTLGIVIIVLIVSAGMLAFVVLYNLNNINITERQRELATLKVLGFFDGEVSQYVLRENIILTIAGILFGAVFGILLHRYIIVTVEVDAVMFGRNIPADKLRILCGDHLYFLDHRKHLYAQKTQEDRHGRITEICQNNKNSGIYVIFHQSFLTRSKNAIIVVSELWQTLPFTQAV